MKKALINILCAFIPNPVKRHKIRNKFLNNNSKVYYSLTPYYNNGKNNKIFIIENGKRKQLSKFQKISNLKISFEGSNNEIEIEFPVKFNKNSGLFIKYNSQHNKFFIGQNFRGCIGITAFTSNSILKIGKNVTTSGSVIGSMAYNNIYIGDDCMISTNILFQCDGHSIIDYESGKLLNKQKYDIRIGNHCWLGMNTTYLKGAQIPDDCIVAFGSIVTKKIDQPHSVIAGNPAKIVRGGVSWHFAIPCDYDKLNLIKKYKKR